MSENEYLLRLTERERLVACRLADIPKDAAWYTRDERAAIASLLDKLRALEPIGTGGTTEGNG